MKNKETLNRVLDSMKEFKIIGTVGDEVIAEKIIDIIYNYLISETKSLEIEHKNIDTTYNSILSRGMSEINKIIINTLT